MATSSSYNPLTGESDSEGQPLVSNLEKKRKVLRTRAVKWLRVAGRWSRDNLLLILTALSVVLGIVVGLSVHQAQPSRVAVDLLAFPGELFLRMLKMLILPLIVFSLMAGLGSLNAKVAGSLGWRTVLYYLSTTMLAIVLGLVLVLAIRPGGRSEVTTLKPCDNSSLSISGHELDTLDAMLDLLRNVFPDNLFVATFKQAQTVYVEETVTSWRDCILQNNENFTNCSAAVEQVESMRLNCQNATRVVRSIFVETRNGVNILGIIVFSIVFSIFLSRLGERGKGIVAAIATLNEVILSMIWLIMWYSPIGIASIIAGRLADVKDFGVLVEQIGLYMVTVLLGLTIHGCIVLPLLYLLMTRSNPLKLVRQAMQALLTALGTSSSSATLPITIRCLEEKANIDSRVTRFMLPIGATINMDGTALYEAVAAVFIAQVEGVDTSFAKILVISITATAASIGAAGVPSAGLVTMVIVLVAVGLPPEDVVLVISVDWLLDRFRTLVNVLGDCIGVGIVYHHSKKLFKVAKPPVDDASASASTSALPLSQLSSSKEEKTPDTSSSRTHSTQSSPLQSRHLPASTSQQPGTTDHWDAVNLGETATDNTATAAPLPDGAAQEDTTL